MKYCPHCHQPLPKGAKTCPECGEPLKQPKAAQQHKSTPLILLLIGIMILTAAIIGTTIFNMSKKESHTAGHPETDPPVHIITTAPLGENAPAVTAPPDSGEETPEITVTLDDYLLTQDLFGQDILLVGLNFYNGKSVNTRFMSECRAQVFQNGVSCEETIPNTDYSMNVSAEVQPGATAPIDTAFVVKPDQDVQIVVTSFNGKKTYLDVTITPAAPET